MVGSVLGSHADLCLTTGSEGGRHQMTQRGAAVGGVSPSYELWPWGKWGGPRGLALGCVQLRKGREPGWLGSTRVWAPAVPSGEPSDRTRAVGGGRLVKAMQSGCQPRSRVSGWAAHGWTGPPEGTSRHGTWVSMARHLLGRIERGVGWVVSSPSQLSQL